MAQKRRSQKVSSRKLIPYGRQHIDKDDIQGVIDVLSSDWITQGPKIQEFETALSKYCGSKHAVVFSSGTAALQAAYFAMGLGPGDEFITSPITFASTANAGIWLGAKPVFADIDPATGNLDPGEVVKKITKRTKAIMPVDLAGCPADLDKFKNIARKNRLTVVEDACHALGAEYKGQRIGSISDMTCFSFHPVKSITTGEGGAVTTNNRSFYDKLVLFRNHGITKDPDKLKDKSQGGWYYEMQELGLNYRLTDIQASLGITQLKKLPGFLKKRRSVAAFYFKALSGMPDLILPDKKALNNSSWHLFVVRIKNGNRKNVFEKLRQANIGVQVHYIPVYWHPYYQKLGYKRGLCPKAEEFYLSAISLPIFSTIKKEELTFIVNTLKSLVK